MDVVEKNLKNHVQALASEIGSRSIREPINLRRAQEYIHGRFQESGLEVKEQRYSAFGEPTANLLAGFPGTDHSSPLLLLGAHYDTVMGTPGADDNASAVAVMLETARFLAADDGCASPGVIFAAFSTEEPPSFNTMFMGSRVFVKSLPDTGLAIGGALVLEMVGYYSDEPGSQDIPMPLKWMGFPSTGNFIAVVGNGTSKPLVKAVSAGIADSGCGLPVQDLAVPGNGYLLPDIRLSDNASFWDAGIPAVMITDTSWFRNPHYHSHTDRPETLNYQKMGQLVVGLTKFFLENASR
ncbi:MAG: M28 family peptidase [bacterium]|nr:M28 family peptidase [bacterium]